jgi:4-alpha-glucanotransferase
LYGLETSFKDGLGEFREAPPESVLATLQSLGACLHTLSDVPEELRRYRLSLRDRLIEPITVAWYAEPANLGFRALDPTRVKTLFKLESGERKNLDLSQAREIGEEGRWVYPLPSDLPCGYHHLEVDSDLGSGQTMLIVSPKLAFSSPRTEPQWGVFLPLYALSSRRNWGAGDFTDLARLTQWLASLGGSFVGTLPLFSAFLQNPFDPSPYAPVSRLFWNEFFIDPIQTQEWKKCAAAMEIFSSAAFQKELLEQRSSSRVHYRDQMYLKRRVLELLAKEFYASGYFQQPGFQSFLERYPSVRHYAEFRAVQESLSRPWQEWPQRMREGTLLKEDYAAGARDYHIYVQWVADQQMQSIREHSRVQNVGLYLDLPLGVHPDGYDVWSNQNLFAPQVTGGAPPDSFFTDGQNWGFRPLHPEWSRLEHHSYFRQILSHLMNQSDLLRIDHVMNLHRLYWVPAGFSAKDGVYVHYPSEELFAILALESHRHECIIVGEDLGTVPEVVRESMADHGIHRMYVTIFEFSSSSDAPLNYAPPDTMTSMNTHDTATFAAFWQKLDIEERRKMELLDDRAYEEEIFQRNSVLESLCRFFSIDGDRRNPKVQLAVLKALLNHMSRSESRYLLLNLEDFWLETVSQNVPGTGPERPNWRQKTQLAFEDFSGDLNLLQVLREIDSLRRQRGQRA